MTIAYIGLGSNLEDPRAQVSSAMAELEGLPASRVLGKSSLYLSAPLGPSDQPDFINAVVKLETGLTPAVLLRHIQALEHGHGRRRERHWGPRTLDLDLLLYGNKKIKNRTLTVPHPEIGKRNFVLCPLLELAPGIEIPGQGPARELLRDLDAAGAGRIAPV